MKVLIPYAEKYLKKNKKYLKNTITPQELAKAGMICLLTAKDEPRWDDGEAWNKSRYDAIDKAFGRMDCRRSEDGKRFDFEDTQGIYINWIVIGEAFANWVEGQWKKEVGMK